MSDLRQLLARYDALPTWARWAIGLAGVGLAWAVAAIVLPEGAPVGRVVSGMILGAATALTSISLITSSFVTVRKPAASWKRLFIETGIQVSRLGFLGYERGGSRLGAHAARCV